MEISVLKQGRYIELAYTVGDIVQSYCTIYESLKRNQKGELVSFKAIDKANRITRALSLLEKLEKVNSKTTKAEILKIINA